MVILSGFDTKLTLIATFTFPSGINLNSMTKETDPLDVPVTDIAGNVMTINGEIGVFSMSGQIDVKYTCMANTEDYKNLSTLYNNNRPEPGKLPVNDKIFLTIVYPDGQVESLYNGYLRSGPPVKSIASDSHLKSMEYNFTFERYARVSN